MDGVWRILFLPTVAAAAAAFRTFALSSPFCQLVPVVITLQVPRHTLLTAHRRGRGRCSQPFSRIRAEGGRPAAIVRFLRKWRTAPTKHEHRLICARIVMSWNQ